MKLDLGDRNECGKIFKSDGKNWLCNRFADHPGPCLVDRGPRKHVKVATLVRKWRNQTWEEFKQAEDKRRYSKPTSPVYRPAKRKQARDMEWLKAKLDTILTRHKEGIEVRQLRQLVPSCFGPIVEALLEGWANEGIIVLTGEGKRGSPRIVTKVVPN